MPTWGRLYFPTLTTAANWASVEAKASKANIAGALFPQAFRILQQACGFLTGTAACEHNSSAANIGAMGVAPIKQHLPQGPDGTH